MNDRTFRTATTVGISLDGYIARPDGDVEWLTARGAEAGDTGYEAFMAGIDTLALGRNTYEKVLTFGFWPYEGKRVAVLSTRLVTDDPRITVHRTLDELLAGLVAQGAERVYVDGGALCPDLPAGGAPGRADGHHGPGAPRLGPAPLRPVGRGRRPPPGRRQDPGRGLHAGDVRRPRAGHARMRGGDPG